MANCSSQTTEWPKVDRAYEMIGKTIVDNNKREIGSAKTKGASRQDNITSKDGRRRQNPRAHARKHTTTETAIGDRRRNQH